MFLRILFLGIFVFAPLLGGLAHSEAEEPEKSEAEAEARAMEALHDYLEFNNSPEERLKRLAEAGIMPESEEESEIVIISHPTYPEGWFYAQETEISGNFWDSDDPSIPLGKFKAKIGLSGALSQFTKSQFYFKDKEFEFDLNTIPPLKKN